METNGGHPDQVDIPESDSGPLEDVAGPDLAVVFGKFLALPKQALPRVAQEGPCVLIP